MERPVMKRAPSFLDAMDKGLLYTKNEKGSTAYTSAGVGDQLVAFDEKLVRGLTNEQIKNFINDVIKQSKTLNSNDGMNVIVDLCVLMVHVRNIKNGKGERELFYNFFINIYYFKLDVLRYRHNFTWFDISICPI